MAEQAITVDVSELQTLARDFDAAGGRLGSGTATAIRRAARTVQKTARDRVPTDHGNLKRSITTSYDGDGRSAQMSATIGTPFFTGRFVEDGTAFQRPRPFMGPALEAGQEELQKLIADAVDKAI